MRLKILLPTEVLLEREVTKVTAEAVNGSFCLLPRHIDFVAALVPGLLIFEAPDAQEEFVAVDEGVLVKQGAQVWVSTRHAVHGPELGTLQQTIATRFERLNEREQRVRSALARLEADLVRRFLEFQE